MAYNVAANIQPSSFNPVGVLQQVQQNALAQRRQANEDSSSAIQQGTYQNALQQQANAKQEQDQMKQAQQTLAETNWALQAPSKVQAINSLPHVVDALKAKGLDTTQLTEDQATQLLQGVKMHVSSILGQGPPEQKLTTVAPGASLVNTTPGQTPSVAYASPPAPITPYQQASLDLTKRGQDMTDKRDAAKLKASTNPMGIGEGGAPGAAGVRGDSFLQTLDPNIAAQVKALADGRMQFPSGFALKTPYWQQMLSAVSQYDPNFDQVNYNARAKTRSDFTSGKNAQNIKALNTAIGHLGTLNDQIDATASGDLTPLNYLRNKGAELTGSAGPTQFNQTAGALASELTQVFRGSGGAEADVKRYLSELNVNASKEQKKAAVQNIVTLLNSRLSAIGDQYNQGMGTTADPLTLLNPHAQDVLRKVGGASSQESYALPADIQALVNKHASK